MRRFRLQQWHLGVALLAAAVVIGLLTARPGREGSNRVLQPGTPMPEPAASKSSTGEPAPAPETTEVVAPASSASSHSGSRRAAATSDDDEPARGPGPHLAQIEVRSRARIDGRRPSDPLREAVMRPLPSALVARPPGRLDQGKLHQELRRHRRGVRACAAIDETGSAAAGKVGVSWLILPNGRTAHITIREARGVDATTARCIQRSVAGWRFTPPTGGAAAASMSVVLG